MLNIEIVDISVCDLIKIVMLENLERKDIRGFEGL